MENPLKWQFEAVGRGLPAWFRMAVRIPFLFLAVHETLMRRIGSRDRDRAAGCRSLSVLVPTLNEEERIISCIRSVSENRHVREIIVVDAGSHDQTRRKARKAGARVMIHDRPVESGGGRGGQIRAGIRAARGDVVAILHADTMLPSSEIDRMMALLERNPDIAGGAVGCRFDSPRLRYRLIELGNDFRTAFLGISFGDQVQFFRRRPVVGRDLFPDIPLMEDVEFSLRLRGLGRKAYLFGNALSSARRWERAGSRSSAWVFRQVSEYLVRRVRKTPDTPLLYRKYHGRR